MPDKADVSVWPLVLADMVVRDFMKRVATSVVPGHGTLVDAYEDALNLAVHLRCEIELRAHDGDVDPDRRLAMSLDEAGRKALIEMTRRWMEAEKEALGFRKDADAVVDMLAASGFVQKGTPLLGAVEALLMAAQKTAAAVERLDHLLSTGANPHDVKNVEVRKRALADAVSVSNPLLALRLAEARKVEKRRAKPEARPAPSEEEQDEADKG